MVLWEGALGRQSEDLSPTHLPLLRPVTISTLVVFVNEGFEPQREGGEERWVGRDQRTHMLICITNGDGEDLGQAVGVR